VKLIRINNRLINLEYIVDAALVQDFQGGDLLLIQLAVPQPTLSVSKPQQLVEVKGDAALKVWEFLNSTGGWVECSCP
jgi:hypothetical protein